MLKLILGGAAGAPSLRVFLRKGGIPLKLPVWDLCGKLFLGGAALQRCGNCIIVNEALTAEVT